eukprot:1075592-Pelagomonas_calceolata.AAC.3
MLAGTAGSWSYGSGRWAGKEHDVLLPCKPVGISRVSFKEKSFQQEHAARACSSHAARNT